MLSALVVVPNSDGQALFGEINDIRHENKLKIDAVGRRKLLYVAHLFIKFRIEGVPFNSRFLSTIRRGFWQQDTKMTM